jgi:hypothetical protein
LLVGDCVRAIPLKLILSLILHIFYQDNKVLLKMFERSAGHA